MKKFLAASILPLGALLAFAAPAQAQAESASATINRLQAQGFDVRISRVGNAPLSECTVAGVRNLPGAPLPFTLNDDDDFNVFTVVPKQKVAVSLNCSN
ncbi:hypothetical protein FHR72_002601 [Mycolicibacterium iranicum]|uniref:PASTA domain-containing protein n=1 Tax=Mycolicibacterium iranicum TaxID=912594 RepID=A0A839Q4E7_MYCIR|nr:hypothetical protein [Mycolicibacterium iranicum]MBB2991128.1 hypothetical protein [Mycolicibacterium iranicum]